jgi:hypothetical protein
MKTLSIIAIFISGFLFGGLCEQVRKYNSKLCTAIIISGIIYALCAYMCGVTIK